jgi:phytoene dehydrogenase-like protein
MPERRARSAVVVGSGPNGLVAAIELAKGGFETTLLEAQPSIGGGLHSAELTLPGFVHDVCSAVHPLGISSPAFAQYPLSAHGLEWIQPPLPLAHPLDGGRVATLSRDIAQTEEQLGGEKKYARLASALSAHWRQLLTDFLKPLLLPKHPLLMARFGVHALKPATWEAKNLFKGEAGRALFGGIAAHSALPLNMPGSAAFGWVLALAAHTVGWPIPRGGSQSVANSLGSYFKSLGGTILTGERVRSLSELRDADLVLCDIGVEEFLKIAGDRLPGNYSHALKRFRRGPAAFKLDWALNKPIPWQNAECARAGTVHLGGTLEELSESEAAMWRGVSHAKPFVLLAQQSLFDSSRAPAGFHSAWAYCHVPNDSDEDMTGNIEAQVERFAPGFRSCILKRHVMRPRDFESLNPNFAGGDILGGAQTLKQVVFRPNRHFYWTPINGVYLCSGSTPPGGGVHGMCGYHAARLAMKNLASKA